MVFQREPEWRGKQHMREKRRGRERERERRRSNQGSLVFASKDHQNRAIDRGGNGNGSAIKNRHIRRAGAGGGRSTFTFDGAFFPSFSDQRAEREIEDERLFEFRVEIFPFPNSAIRGASSSVYHNKNNLNAALISAPCHYLKIIFGVEERSTQFPKRVESWRFPKTGIGHSLSRK